MSKRSTQALDVPIATPAPLPPEGEKLPRGYVIAAFEDGDIRKVRPDDVKGASLVIDGPEHLEASFEVDQMDAALANGLKVAVVPSKTKSEAARRLWDYFIAVASEHSIRQIHCHEPVHLLDAFGNKRVAEHYMEHDVRTTRRADVDMSSAYNRTFVASLRGQKLTIWNLLPADRYLSDVEIGRLCDAAGLVQKKRDGLWMWRYYAPWFKGKGLTERGPNIPKGMLAVDALPNGGLVTSPSSPPNNPDTPPQAA